MRDLLHFVSDDKKCNHCKIARLPLWGDTYLPRCYIPCFGLGWVGWYIFVFLQEEDPEKMSPP